MNQSIKADIGLGANLRKCRKQRGMTQDRVAAQLQVRGCDISRGTLAKIEAGIRHVSVTELKAIKSVLDVGYGDLFE